MYNRFRNSPGKKKKSVRERKEKEEKRELLTISG